MFLKRPCTLGPGVSTDLPSIDMETYSEAGYLWDANKNKWKGLPNAPKNLRSIFAVGTERYAAHPSTEILSIAYDLKNYDNKGERLWTYDQPPPIDLFEYINAKGLLSAWHSPFEFFIWLYVAHYRMGWPYLPFEQLRDSMAKARRCALPGKLGEAGEVLNILQKKDKRGDKYISMFSVPRNPTKANPNLRLHPLDAPEDFKGFNSYNIQDIRAENNISNILPDLSEYETQVWLLDQKINYRGVAIDKESLEACLRLVNEARTLYTQELQAITWGEVSTVDELKNITEFLHAQGVHLDNLDAETVTETLKRTDLPNNARRVLEIRSTLGSASIKKLYAIERQLSHESRLHGLFAYCGADRTGRFAGQGPQPQNLKGNGPNVRQCDNFIYDKACGTLYSEELNACPTCGAGNEFSEPKKWDVNIIDSVLKDARNCNLEMFERKWPAAVETISGCLRGLFVAAPGAELIGSDFSAIEAVVLAVISGEQWRIDVFKSHGLIYEQTLSDITGIPFSEIVEYQKQNGVSHPLRTSMGKIPELASGYQGSVGAWKKFGAGAYMTDDEILMNVRKWRAKSPNIVKFWYEIEKIAILAIQNPGEAFFYRDIGYAVKIDPTTQRKILFCKLPSGRMLYYWDVGLRPDTTPRGKPTFKITYWGHNSDYKKGPKGWMELDTYGGKLTENITQAIARDIQVHAMLNLEKAGYPIVLHVHDEDVAEVKKGTGSIEEFERIMQIMPSWAQGWPIKAAGGWRGYRYRKG